MESVPEYTIIHGLSLFFTVFCMAFIVYLWASSKIVKYSKWFMKDKK